MADENVIPVAILIFGGLVIAAELGVFFFSNQQQPKLLGLQEVRVFGITIAAILVSALAASDVPGDRIIILIACAFVGGVVGYLVGRNKQS